MNDAAPQLLEQYTAALQDYLAGGGEAALLRAYELGRSAIVNKLNVLEMVALHQEALVAANPGEGDRLAYCSTREWRLLQAFLLTRLSGFS